MSIWPASQGTAPALFGAEGELVLLQISVEPRLLEDLLELLARLEFPVNPDLYHKPNSVSVEFPAYSGRVEEVRKLLNLNGFDQSCLAVQRALVAHES
jgi:hypothetical protein